jgi:hypothetical protein
VGRDWTARPLRFSQVPWLSDMADLRPMGPPETAVECGETDLTLGLWIPHPFGRDTDATLSIHATVGNGNDGGTITLAISNVVYKRDEDAKPVKRTTKFYPPDDANDLGD